MKFCPECGAGLAAATRFCTACGVRLPERPAAASAVPPVPPVAPPVVAPPVAPAVVARELPPLRPAPRTGGLPSLIAMFAGLAVVSGALTYVVLQK